MISEEEEVIAAPSAKKTKAKPAKAAASAASKSKKPTKKKKKKDPNAPKRPMNAFFLYSNANRARIKEENPDAKFTEIPGIASAEFKMLSDKEASRWQKAAAEDKARYRITNLPRTTTTTTGGRITTTMTIRRLPRRPRRRPRRARPRSKVL